MKLQNKDTVAYLKVNNTNISYPVVKSSNNSYYLNHNFEKSYNEAGWIFADYKNKFDGTDKNIVIYGRNRRDLSMFGSLKNILDTNWYNKKENLKIEFITDDVENIYEIFSIYKIENEDYYIKTEFANNEFSEFINTLKNRSIKNFNTNVDENDNIFTLSTCVDNNKYRIVLHAKKMQ